MERFLAGGGAVPHNAPHTVAGRTVNELQVVGYTSDLRFIIFTDADDGSVRYRAPVDEDLVATMDELVHLFGPERRGATGADVSRTRGGRGPRRAREVPLAVAGLLAEGRVDQEDEPEQPPARHSKLSPREIQALLRSGRSPAVVARMAGTDRSWVERWLPPIEAERAQVLAAVQQSRLSKARLGPSRDMVGEAVRRNLAAKGVRPDDPSVEWRVSRRNGTESWTVELRYRNRGRRQRAVWAFDQELGHIEARNDLALEVAWTRSRRAGDDNASRQAAPAAGGTSTKAGRKATKAGKATGKKTSRKATAARTAPRKAPTGRATAKRATPKKATPKKATPKKATPKKATPKKATRRSRAAR
jgi:hypothetical protein